MRKLDERTFVAGQIWPEDVADAAAAGVTMIVNNRPDFEEADQPEGAEIAAAARAAGVEYRFVPISSGISEAQIAAMAEALEAVQGKALAFCRSGTRSTFLWALARSQLGVGSRCNGERRRPATTSHRSKPFSTEADSSRPAGQPSALRFGGQNAARLVEILVVDHQADRDDAAQAFPAHLGIEGEGFHAILGKDRARQARLEAVIIFREFDERHYQGTTSPASISAGRGARPRIALRCGKRPNRATMSRCAWRSG